MPRTVYPIIRRRVILLIVLSVAPLCALVAYDNFADRTRDAAAVREESMQLVRVVADDHRRFIDSAHQVLNVLALVPAVRRREAAACSSLFSELLDQYPQYANIGLAAPDGNVLASGISLKQPVNVADRAFFQRAIATGGFSVGDFQVGRITGKPGLNMGFPVMGDIGAVVAVVFVDLDLDWLDEFADRTGFPEGTTLTIFDSSGTVLVRHQHPASEIWVGTTLPETPILKAFREQGREGSVETRGPDGRERLYAFTMLAERSDAGEVYACVGVPTDVAFASAQRELIRNLLLLAAVTIAALMAAWFGAAEWLLRKTEEVERLATTDGLTGLLTRRSFDELAEMEFRRARRLGGEMSALMIDIDFFKKVNDRFGHSTGDDVLRELGRLLQGIVRDVDLVGRYGGEEFSVLLLEVNATQGLETAGRIREAVAKSGISTSRGPVTVTVSVGIATLRPEDVSFAGLLGRADAALYHAKLTGRNRVEVA
ncbi:MAG: sensor domain-containing diguanylate cyclase [Planctomycetes bacterium]|nr:sensor domain-containing diguanylate cyclase [Planctomycetota bacterium]